MTAARRIDLLLVERGFFASRAKAQEAIAAGLVMASGRRVTKPAEVVEADAAIEAGAPYPWVSRGGVKLAAALDRFGYDPSGQVCLDIGASTGGFTDVLLARGAVRVHAVDVGHAQMHPRLAADARVHLLEHQDARDLRAAHLPQRPTAVTCDVSFISLALVLPKVLPLASAGAWLVALVKPQFEVGPAAVTKGLVKDPAARERAVEQVRGVVEQAGWTNDAVIPSPIAGGDGNCEFLLGARLA